MIEPEKKMHEKKTNKKNGTRIRLHEHDTKIVKAKMKTHLMNTQIVNVVANIPAPANTNGTCLVDTIKMFYYSFNGFRDTKITE